MTTKGKAFTLTDLERAAAFAVRGENLAFIVSTCVKANKEQIRLQTENDNLLAGLKKLGLSETLDQ